jgi:four helix bundle suffix protein
MLFYVVFLGDSHLNIMRRRQRMYDKGNEDTNLFEPHGGYAKLITYKLGLLIYDATVAFCNRYIPRKERTYDQMVQAARSGVSNIAEGSAASATSKKTEIKLTNVANSSQEELYGDYTSFLRQQGLPLWEADSAPSKRVREARVKTIEELWQLMQELFAARTASAESDSEQALLRQEIYANTMICLIRQETFLLTRQLARLAKDFENNGGFTERLYRKRNGKRLGQDPL